MAKIDIKSFEAAPGASGGITIAYASSVSGNYIRIGISKTAQETYFGKLLDPEKDAFRIEVDDDPDLKKYAQLMLVGRAEVKDAHGLHGAGFGSVVLKLVPWISPQSDKIKSQQVRVDKVSNFIVRITLPAWAQPGKAQAAAKKIGEGKSILDELPIRK